MSNGICSKTFCHHEPWRPGGRGRPPKVDMRQILNGILYLNKTGCQWRMIPPTFGHWSTIYGYFKRWRCQGIWRRLMEALRRFERRCGGRNPEPSAGSIDSQSIKTATQHEDVGFDGNKRIKGRKRHILVDTLGLIIAVVVTDASTDDRQGLGGAADAIFCRWGQAAAQNLGRWGPIPPSGLMIGFAA